MYLAATVHVSLQFNNRRNLAEQTEDLVVRLARGLALQLGYAVTPSIAATRTGPRLPSGHVPILDHAVTEVARVPSTSWLS